MKKFLHVSVVASVAMLLLLGPGCAGLTATEAPVAQATQTPLQQLVEGNARYASGNPIHPHQDVERREELAKGQHPVAIVVGCADSRVAPELLFDQGLGDIFVVRVAGNVVDDQALGSIEYAVEHLHAHLIVVLGHEKCGAVKATVDGGEVPGHIGSIVHAIQPSVDEAKHEPGDVLDHAINANVIRVVNQIKASKPILSHAVETKEITVVGARYNLAPGTVEWLTKP